MGQHYRADVEGGSIGFLKSMYKCARWCQWVEPNEGAKGDAANVMFYRNRNGFGMPPAKLSAPSTKSRNGMTLEYEGDSE